MRAAVPLNRRAFLAMAGGAAAAALTLRGFGGQGCWALELYADLLWRNLRIYSNAMWKRWLYA